MFYFSIWRVNEHIEYLITAPPLKISHSTYSEWLSAAKLCQQQHTCSFKLIIMSINSCFISLNIKLRISVQREILYACFQTKAGFPIQNNTRDLKMTGIIIQNNTYCKDYSVAKKHIQHDVASHRYDVTHATLVCLSTNLEQNLIVSKHSTKVSMNIFTDCILLIRFINIST